jgi:hypothetical protein
MKLQVRPNLVDTEQIKAIQSMRVTAMIHIPAYMSIWKRAISQKIAGISEEY